ncbi:MAG: hypothetical protein JWN22_1765 [Nocardioides sp.]|nr:hypothetical protein [Nocardioides sp.]
MSNSREQHVGLSDISGWRSMTVGQGDRKLQRSWCPDAYATSESLARDIVAHESVAPPIS